MLNYYYPKTLWGITVALLNVFQIPHIYRHDISGNPIKEIEVPLVFGPVEKTQQAREVGHPSDTNRYYMHIPRMALVFNGIAHSPDRAASSNEERFWLDERIESNISTISDFQPVPYDYSFTLYLRCESMEDLSQILENLLPYFNPKLMMPVKEFSFLNIERDLPVTLSNINIDFTDALDSDTMRETNASLDLIVAGWSYKPITSGSLVEKINFKFLTGIPDGYDISGNPLSGSSLNFLNSEVITEGYYEQSSIPTSGYSTSGYNIDTNVYYTQIENTFE